ncbi:MAG: hypothetical protein ACJA06_001403 [Halocynthiibacter sp.]|jgi:hypothetical protein
MEWGGVMAKAFLHDSHIWGVEKSEFSPLGCTNPLCNAEQGLTRGGHTRMYRAADIQTGSAR